MSLNRHNKAVKEAGFFFIANLLAGVLNYFYQVLASRQLDRTEFADVSSWLAHVSIFLMFGGILQNVAIFLPSKTSSLNRQIIALNAIILLITAGFFYSGNFDPLLVGVITVIIAAATGWITGQVQNRMMFTVMGVVNILSSSLKLLWLAIPILAMSVLDRYYTAFFLTAIPSVWLMSWALYSTPKEGARSNAKSLELWLAPIVLSAASATIPQIDLVVLRRTLSPDVFADFARASLFYKGVFFLFLIGAQWLLPLQIRQRANMGKMSLGSYWLLPIALVGSGIVAAIAPTVAIQLLKWTETPPTLMIFLSCLNMCLLTWLFILIQEFCALGRPKAALPAFLILGTEVVVQLMFRLPATEYLYMVVVMQLFVLGWLIQKTRPALGLVHGRS